MELSGIAVLAVAIAGLLTIPFVANSLTSYAIDNYNEALAPVFNETPENFSSTDASRYPGVSEDILNMSAFRKSAKTAFGEFYVEVRDSDIMMGLKRPGRRVSISKSSSPAKTVWTLETPQYVLEITERPDEVVESITTPSGTCKKVMRMGEARESCSGLVTRIDTIWEDAKEALREEAELMKKASDSIDMLNMNSAQWKYS